MFFRGSVISRIVGANVKDHPNLFQEQVQMFVHEELVEGRKLTDIINSEHENVKYLKGFKLPENVVSVIIELGRFTFTKQFVCGMLKLNVCQQNTVHL